MLSFVSRWFRYFPVCVIAFAATVSGVLGREFTNSAGQKIEAELLAHAGNKVIISSGGKEFTLNINSFSLDDQAYIAKWITDNPDATRFDFRYFIDLDKGSSSNAKVDYDELLQTIPMTYSISVSNQSPGPLKDATFECMVFVEDFVDTRNNRFRSLNSGIKPRSGRIQRLLASTKVPVVNSNGRVDFDIEFPIHYYIDRDGGRVDNAVKDVVLGVWIRIQKGDRVIEERIDAEDKKKMQSLPWKADDIEKTEAKIDVK